MVKLGCSIAYRFGPFVLNCEWNALLAADGAEVRLRPKSFALLRLLVENPGRLISKHTLIEALWPDVYVTENNLTQCIHEIRHALGAEARRVLRTYPRRGYAFIAEVNVVESSRSLTSETKLLLPGSTTLQQTTTMRSI